MKPKTFEDIQDEYREDIIWNELNASSKVSKCSRYVAKYQKYYFNGLSKLHDVEETLGNKYQSLYIEYKMDFEIKLSSSEIKTFIETNSEYLKLKKAQKKLEAQINFFEECIKNINSIRWDIKTFLEMEKFKQGIV